jgi:filamin
MAQALGQHKYEISFVPRENVDHQISVRFNNEPVPGSPFICRLLNALKVTASGPGLERIAVGRAVDFTIDINRPESQSRDASMPQVIVTDSKGHRLPVSVSKDSRSRDSGRFIAEYTPRTVGNHHVEILVDGEQISGSPFSVKAFDSSAARLSLNERAVINKPCTFVIDASKSGAGNMEIIVSVDDKNVPNFVQVILDVLAFLK